MYSETIDQGESKPNGAVAAPGAVDFGACRPEVSMSHWRFRRSFVSCAIALAVYGAQPADAQTNQTPRTPVFLVIDDDSIDERKAPNNFSASAINDNIAKVGLRTQLPYFQQNPGRTIPLFTGGVGDEGWFAVPTIPTAWAAAGPTADGLRNFLGKPSQVFPHNVGPGLGAGTDPERLLDKIPGVTPLGATSLGHLVGWTVCAVVFDSDISINYSPLNGSLKGANLGTVAFEVLSATPRTGKGRPLPQMNVKILDARQLCEETPSTEPPTGPPAPPVPAPTIAASVAPAASAAGWHNGNVTVSFACTNATSCPEPVTVTTQGAGQVIERTVQNTAGSTATARITLNIDKALPVLNVSVPSSAAPGATLMVTVSSTDLSGLTSTALKIDGVAAGARTAAPFDLPATLPMGVPEGGRRTLEITGVDRAGNSALVLRFIEIVALDTQGPAVTLSAPTLAAPGKQIPLVASAQDDKGVVHLKLEQVAETGSATLGELTTGPFLLQHSFTVPDAPDGTQIVFSARARDAAGNVATGTATVSVQRTIETPTLTLQVDPPASPTFQASSVITGRINSSVTSEVPAAPPFIAGLTTTMGHQGDTLDVGITGANTTFDVATTQVAFGPGIAVLNLTVTGPGDLVARIGIDPKASLGPRLVVVMTGKQEAVLPNAFTVIAGSGGVSGRLVTATAPAVPIPNGQICAAGTTLCTTSNAGGTFTLANVPTTAGRITVVATTFETASVPIALRPGQTLSLGDLTMAGANLPPPPPDPGAPVLPAPLGSAVARMSISFAQPETLTRENARKLVIDAVLLVGADELGVLDTSGSRLNPDISGHGPISLTDDAVSLQARGLQQGVSTTLEELWFAMVMGFEWTDPGPPSLDAFMASLQNRVNEAWADPSAPQSSLAILLFNQGAAFSRLAPQISRQTRVNGLQALFIYLGPLLQGYYAKTGAAETFTVPEAFASSSIARQGRMSWLTRALRGTVGTLSASRGFASATHVSHMARSSFAPRVVPRVPRGATRAEALRQGGGGVVSRRQLSRSLREAASGFVKNLALNIAGNLLFGLPAAAAAGGLLGVTVFTATVGALTDTFLFSAIGVLLAAKLAPPPPQIESVAQVGNKVEIKVKRVPLDLRCRTGLLLDPASTAGLCNFQYTLYRAHPVGTGAPGRGFKVVTARYVPPLERDNPLGTFTIEDNFPQIGSNFYYADVIHKFPMSLTEGQRTFASILSLPTRIGVPVGNVISLFFLTELISDFSEPNPFMDPPPTNWDRVHVDFRLQATTSNFAYMRSDLLRNVFAADVRFDTLRQVAPGGSGQAFTPSFGRPIGVDTDRLGNVYTVSDQSQGKFGARVFQFTPFGGQNFIGTVNKYSPLLDFGRPVDVAALALGPVSPGQAGAFVPGDIFVADNIDRSIKRLITSLIPADGIGGLPAPGGRVFGALAASPIVGRPYLEFPPSAESSQPIRDMVFDRANNLWVLVGQRLYRAGYDADTGTTTGAVAVADVHPDPRNLAVDSIGNVFISDRTDGSVAVLQTNSATSTFTLTGPFVSGITGLGAIAVNSGYLYASRGADVVRLPLGISGHVAHSDGQPARQARVTVRGAGGFHARATFTDSGGNFNVDLESLGLVLAGDQLRLFLTITTQGTEDRPSRTEEVEVLVSVSDAGERTQTTVSIQLGGS